MADLEVLRRVEDGVLRLLTGLERMPRLLRIKTGGVELELEWPEQAMPAQPTEVGGPAAAAEPADRTEDAATWYVTAQTVGVFYQAPEPGAAPFVDVGTKVAAGQQVGIIEAMKLMLPVTVELAGRVVDVLVADAAPVEYGERLFAIEPAER
ncbi:MAG TPA: biotin/lipoyl-containing protein [Pseudonocardiaceae bacterium]|nr:biotin/lipoyl-containing protein [Pseudonocardiaceae bacterium]